MTNEEALILLNFSRKAFSEISDIVFGTAITDAEEQLEKIEFQLKKIGKPSEEYNKYEKELEVLYRENSKKNADNSIKTVFNAQLQKSIYVFDAKNSLRYLHEKDKLDKKYVKEIEIQKEKNKNVEKALHKDAKFNQVEISEKDWPEKMTIANLRIARKLLIKIK